MPDDPDAFDVISEQFAANHASHAALVAQAQSWTGVAGPAELGSFDTVAPVDGGEIGNIYARLAALSVQRLRVLSDQLAKAFAEHGVDAFVRDRLIYNPGTEEVEVAGEDITALAKLELEERKLLQNLLTTAVRLQLEARSAEVVAAHGRRMAELARSVCLEAGLEWNDAARRLAQRAVMRIELEAQSAQGR